MIFYKYFTILLFTLAFAANAPLSVFFITQSVEDGQKVTIKNISANNRGDWRIALMGEDAANFRINGQQADFEPHEHYVQLPNSLAVGAQWDFILTAQGLAAGQHEVELVLWTTQGQSQHPFNGMIIGRKMLYYIVEHEEEQEKEYENEDAIEENEEKVPEAEEEKTPEAEFPVADEAEAERPASTPSMPEPEAETPTQTPQMPDFSNIVTYDTAEERVVETEGSAPIPAPVAPILSRTEPQPVTETAENLAQPQAVPPSFVSEMPAQTLRETPELPSMAPARPAIEENLTENLVEEETEIEAAGAQELELPAMTVANPQTSNNTKFVRTFISFKLFVFSIIFLTSARKRA